ncbi:hypothetical protein GQ457_05G013710 [Hibiscus cannabinus]
MVGWIKVNVDGAVGGNDNRTSIGGVFKDASRAWLFEFSKSIGVCSVIVAELWTTHDAFMHGILEYDD